MQSTRFHSSVSPWTKTPTCKRSCRHLQNVDIYKDTHICCICAYTHAKTHTCIYTYAHTHISHHIHAYTNTTFHTCTYARALPSHARCTRTPLLPKSRILRIKTGQREAFFASYRSQPSLRRTGHSLLCVVQVARFLQYHLRSLH